MHGSGLMIAISGTGARYVSDSLGRAVAIAYAREGADIVAAYDFVETPHAIR
jgi:hypothetical protein